MKIRNLSPAITNSSEEIKEIAGKQIEYHRTENFSRLLRESNLLLLDLIGCNEGKSIFLTCSGSGAMDSAVSNLILPEDRVMIINGGSFGKRWCEICNFYGIKYYEIKPGFGKSPDLEELKKSFEDFRPTIFLMQHVETSSGQLQDVHAIGKLCKNYDCRLIVDSISGFANNKYMMDDWGVDATIISSQKGLALTPGISIVVLNKKLIERGFSKRSYYLDFEKYLGEISDVGLPFTPNVLALKQLNHRLKELKKKGIDKEIEERKKIAHDFRERIKNLPLEIIAENPANAVTGLYTSRTDVKDFFCEMQKKKIFFSPSGGEEGKKFVVGHMGELSTEDNEIFVNELREWLGEKSPDIEEEKEKPDKVVFTSGTWDLFHKGHLNIFKKSKALGKKLIVAVSTDELVKSYKGNTVIPFEQRMEMVKSCKYVDEVIPQTVLTDVKDLKKYGVDIVTIGDDWKDKNLEGLEWAKNNGIEVVYLPYTKDISTSQIIKNIIKNGYDFAFSHGKRGVNKLF